MPSQISANTNDLFVRLPQIDEGAYLRIRQMRPVERAVSPILDHNIELTELAADSREWYRGETLVVPREYMSLRLNPDMNDAAERLGKFADTVKGFAPGSFPGHCHVVRELAEIGVDTCEEFAKLLVRRAKRLSQSACGD